MELTDYYNLTLLFGSALSYLMSLFLWFFPGKHFSNRVLGSLIFFWAFTIMIFALQSKEFNIKYPHLYGIASGFAFLFFPFVYLYVYSYLYEKARNVKKLFIHLLPSFLYFIALSPFYIKDAETKIELLKIGMPAWMGTVNRIGNLVVIAQGILYTILSISTIQKFEYFSSKKLTSSQKYSIKWLKQFVILNIILWGIGTTGAIIAILEIDIPINPFKIFYLGVTLLVLRMGYFSIKNPLIFSINKSGMEVSAREKGETEKVDSSDIDYSKELKVLMNFIENEKPYLNTELNQQHLVEGTSLSKHKISELINRALNKSFYELINEYRIKEAIRLIEEGEYKEQTLASIAENAGFKNQATFYKVFKAHTGQTPHNFIQDLKKS